MVGGVFLRVVLRHRLGINEDKVSTVGGGERKSRGGPWLSRVRIFTLAASLILIE
jgi:hypothetical protein